VITDPPILTPAPQNREAILNIYSTYQYPEPSGPENMQVTITLTTQDS